MILKCLCVYKKIKNYHIMKRYLFVLPVMAACNGSGMWTGMWNSRKSQSIRYLFTHQQKPVIQNPNPNTELPSCENLSLNKLLAYYFPKIIFSPYMLNTKKQHIRSILEDFAKYFEHNSLLFYGPNGDLALKEARELWKNGWKIDEVHRKGGYVGTKLSCNSFANIPKRIGDMILSSLNKEFEVMRLLSEPPLISTRKTSSSDDTVDNKFRILKEFVEASGYFTDSVSRDEFVDEFVVFHKEHLSFEHLLPIINSAYLRLFKAACAHLPKKSPHESVQSENQYLPPEREYFSERNIKDDVYEYKTSMFRHDGSGNPNDMSYYQFRESKILKKKSNLFVRGSTYTSALCWAKKNGREDIANFLMKNSNKCYKS